MSALKQPEKKAKQTKLGQLVQCRHCLHVQSDKLGVVCMRCKRGYNG